MRLLMAFFCMLSVLVAPLGASAMAASAPTGHCAEMADAHPQAPTGMKALLLKDKGCCMAVTAALAPEVEPVRPLPLRAKLDSAPLPGLVAARTDVEVPPPRS